MKPKEKPFPIWADASERDLLKEKIEDFERDKLRKLVNDELRRYGLLLTRKVVPHRDKFRTRGNEHVLYGQVQGHGLLSRELLCEGSFKDCCVMAAELLDALDASQKPDTAAGPDQR